MKIAIERNQRRNERLWKKDSAVVVIFPRLLRAAANEPGVDFIERQFHGIIILSEKRMSLGSNARVVGDLFLDEKAFDTARASFVMAFNFAKFLFVTIDVDVTKRR